MNKPIVTAVLAAGLMIGVGVAFKQGDRPEVPDVYQIVTVDAPSAEPTESPSPQESPPPAAPPTTRKPPQPPAQPWASPEISAGGGQGGGGSVPTPTGHPTTKG